jgi:hypothetical protein
VSPGNLGDALAARPVWFTAMALGGVLVVAGTLLIPAEVWNEMMRAQFLAQGREMPEGAMAFSGTLFRVSSAVGGVIFWALWAFLVSGVTTLIFAFILGDDGRYRQYLSAVSHAFMIAAVGGLLTVPLKIAQSNPQLTLSIGTFAGDLGGGYLDRFLKTLDLFMVWSYVALGILVSRIDTRRGAGSAVSILIVFLLAVTALFALIPRPV